MGGLMKNWPPQRGHALSLAHHHMPAIPILASWNSPLQPTSPQTQETEMMQLASKQVKQQLHKQGIVQAWFRSCPLTWHLHDDSHWQQSAVYLNRKNFSILNIICTSDQ